MDCPDRPRPSSSRLRFEDENEDDDEDENPWPVLGESFPYETGRVLVCTQYSSMVFARVMRESKSDGFTK